LGEWEHRPIPLRGKGFRIDYFGLTAEPTSIQAPGYPVVLWAFWKVLGQTPAAYLALSATQCLAIASMVWPMGALSRRWFPDAPPWIAQATVVIYPLYLWYAPASPHSLCHGPPSLASLDMAGMVQARPVAGYRDRDSLRHRRFVPAGAPWRFCHLRRGSARWRRARETMEIDGQSPPRGPRGSRLPHPWTIRNYKVQGRLILVKSGMAKEFWMGNNPHATGTAFADGGATEVTNAYPPRPLPSSGKSTKSR